MEGLKKLLIQPKKYYSELKKISFTSMDSVDASRLYLIAFGVLLGLELLIFDLEGRTLLRALIVVFCSLAILLVSLGLCTFFIGDDCSSLGITLGGLAVIGLGMLIFLGMNQIFLVVSPTGTGLFELIVVLGVIGFLTFHLYSLIDSVTGLSSRFSLTVSLLPASLIGYLSLLSLGEKRYFLGMIALEHSMWLVLVSELVVLLFVVWVISYFVAKSRNRPGDVFGSVGFSAVAIFVGIGLSLVMGLGGLSLFKRSLLLLKNPDSSTHGSIEVSQETLENSNRLVNFFSESSPPDVSGANADIPTEDERKTLQQFSGLLVNRPVGFFVRNPAVDTASISPKMRKLQNKSSLRIVFELTNFCKALANYNRYRFENHRKDFEVGSTIDLVEFGRSVFLNSNSQMIKLVGFTCSDFGFETTRIILENRSSNSLVRELHVGLKGVSRIKSVREHNEYLRRIVAQFRSLLRKRGLIKSPIKGEGFERGLDALKLSEVSLNQTYEQFQRFVNLEDKQGLKRLERVGSDQSVNRIITWIWHFPSGPSAYTIFQILRDETGSHLKHITEKTFKFNDRLSCLKRNARSQFTASEVTHRRNLVCSEYFDDD